MKHKTYQDLKLKVETMKEAENEGILELKTIGVSLRKKHSQSKRQDGIKNGEWLLHKCIYYTDRGLKCKMYKELKQLDD